MLNRFIWKLWLLNVLLYTKFDHKITRQRLPFLQFLYTGRILLLGSRLCLWSRPTALCTPFEWVARRDWLVSHLPEIINDENHYKLHRIAFLYNTCLVFEYRVAQCLNGLYVQVIGGLVENQKVGLMTTQYSKGHARLLSSRQALDLYAAK